MVAKKYKNGMEYHLHKLYNYFSNPIELQKDERTSGFFGWLLLATYIVAYDAYAIKTKKTETLTRFFWRQTEKPIKSLLPVTLWTGLTVHLLLEKSVRKKAFGNTNKV